MQTANRLVKAQAYDERKEAAMREIEERKLAEVKANEKFRMQEIEGQRNAHAAVRKNEKKNRRRVNIEIASGIVDLIMDLTEETFAAQLAAPGKKL